MLIEKSREDAVKDFVAGKKVIVLCDYEDGSFDANVLEDILPEGFHYLVNEPVTQNPEFAEAVKRITGSSPIPTPEEIIGAVHDTQEEPVSTPPPKKKKIEEDLCCIQEN